MSAMGANVPASWEKCRHSQATVSMESDSKLTGKAGIASDNRRRQLELPLRPGAGKGMISSIVKPEL
jgi:hypothetical protein